MYEALHSSWHGTRLQPNLEGQQWTAHKHELSVASCAAQCTAARAQYTTLLSQVLEELLTKGDVLHTRPPTHGHAPATPSKACPMVRAFLAAGSEWAVHSKAAPAAALMMEVTDGQRVVTLDHKSLIHSVKARGRQL